MSFPRYPKYKDSGVEWLGKVPEHWEVKPLKRLALLQTGMTPPTDDLDNYSDVGPYQWIRPEDINETGIPTTASKFLTEKGWSLTRQVKPGASLICCIGTIGKVGFAVDRVSTNQQITSAKPHHSDRYFYFALLAGRSVLELASTGNVLRILNTERLGGIVFPNPPQHEANHIAAFLDRETAKIDELVAEQQRLMELLKEKRQAVISHAVTKGLNPTAPMKASGIEWLGDVPAHWEVKRIKHLSLRISSGKTPFGGSETYVDEGITFLRSQNVYDEGLRLDDVVFITEAVDAAMAVSRVIANDILLNITGASIGRSCVVPSEFSPANVNQHVCVIRLKDLSQVPFIGWIFKAATIKNQIEYSQNGAAREGLNFAQIGEMAIALPPREEQEAIANFITEQTIKIDTLTSEAQRAIDLLQERRTALISAAVTGQIDVRGNI